MKILRDPRLLFWLVLTCSLSYLLFYSLVNSPTPLSTKDISIRIGASAEYDSLTPAVNFSRRISGTYLAYSGGDFANWSTETYQIAKENVTELYKATGDKDSKVFKDWQKILAVTEELKNTPYGENEAIVQKTSLLNSLTQKLITDVSYNKIGNNYYKEKGVSL